MKARKSDGKSLFIPSVALTTLYMLLCLLPMYSRIVLIGQIDHVNYKGMKGSDSTVRVPWAHLSGCEKLVEVHVVREPLH